MMRSLHCLVLSSAVLVACGGKAIDVGGQPTTGNAVGPEVFSPAQVQAARAQCGQPDGPVQTFATFGAAQATVSGSWLLCSIQADPGNAPNGGWETHSREFDANGQWFDLGLDSQGGLVRLYGVDNQGSWEMTADDGDTSPGASLNGGAGMNLTNDSGESNGGDVAFETAPARMQWSPDYYQAYYVPLGQ